MKPICADWEERLSLYVDGLLNPFDENAVAAHLSRCEACREAVMLWREVGQSIRRLPRELPPADLRARIFAGTTRKPSFVQRLRLGWWQLAPALGVGLFLAWWTLPRSSSVPTPVATQPAPTSFHVSTPYSGPDSSGSSSPSERLPAEMLPADSDTRVVIVVQPASSPRWREPSPRWVVSTRAPAPQAVSHPSESAVLPTPQKIALTSSQPPTPPLLTEVADLPVQTEATTTETASNPPEQLSATNSPLNSSEPTALTQWSEQFHRQLRQENRMRLRQVVRGPHDLRFFVPIFSWNIK
ncbi:hypothetical protein HRbin15_00623 [bacterium HR15]|nr:hypothetical protein HRbin15_00623 [bacterium HR15]